MAKSLCNMLVHPEECKNQLKNFVGIGIDQPILQFNPIGKTNESFELFKKTFLDG